MSFAEDNNHDLDPEFLGLYPYGSDYDLDSETLDEGIEFMVIPAWRMKNGELIAIKDMDTSHIKNCIKMIYKFNGKWRHQYLRYFETELRKRKFLSPKVICL